MRAFLRNPTKILFFHRKGTKVTKKNILKDFWTLCDLCVFVVLKTIFCVAEALPSAMVSDNLMRIDEVNKFCKLIWDPADRCRTNRRRSSGLDIEYEYDDEDEEEEEAGSPSYSSSYSSSSSAFSLIKFKLDCPCRSQSIKKSESPRWLWWPRFSWAGFSGFWG